MGWSSHRRSASDGLAPISSAAEPARAGPDEDGREVKCGLVSEGGQLRYFHASDALQGAAEIMVFPTPGGPAGWWS